MKVFKFGGASVKDAAGIRNLAEIVSLEKGNLVIVVSAFGKTTNALEKVLNSWQSGDGDYNDHLENVCGYHLSIAEELFPSSGEVRNMIGSSFSKLKDYLRSVKGTEYDFDYDQIVSYGEVWSTFIVAEYIKKSGLPAKWIDIRENLITDERYRDANILWDESTECVRKVFDFSSFRYFVTQGFIGGTKNGHTTTLGREGSDYTAAILANLLDAECLIVWKDVPGVLNADPEWLPGSEKLEEMSYREAVEMTFSGAKVIHPKTIKPLQNKNIPLIVKSFVDPAEKGTLVTANPILRKILPVFIRKRNQILITLLPKDFSFVMGDNLSRIFNLFNGNGIKVNLVEASAVSIDVCVDDEKRKVEALLAFLKDEYSAIYNENVEMLSIRHYTPESIERITAGKEILLEQRTRSTVRFVVKG